ncbi:hypothetical protein [Marinactinospora rubrisoli]|uniref:Uncharacterized protein n=1 Tax=Marinactinospora rubrisoli TaxID=2715399 RepID=A0ABW2KI96_9ACTN
MSAHIPPHLRLALLHAGAHAVVYRRPDGRLEIGQRDVVDQRSVVYSLDELLADGVRGLLGWELVA